MFPPDRKQSAQLALATPNRGTHSLIHAGWRPVPTPHVEVRYRVRPESVEDQVHANREWIRNVVAVDEDAVEASVLCSEDGQTFVHRLWFGNEMAGRRWQSLPSEQRFRAETRLRCVEEPEILYLQVLSSTVLTPATGLGQSEAVGATL